MYHTKNELPKSTASKLEPKQTDTHTHTDWHRHRHHENITSTTCTGGKYYYSTENSACQTSVLINKWLHQIKRGGVPVECVVLQYMSSHDCLLFEIYEKW